MEIYYKARGGSYRCIDWRTNVARSGSDGGSGIGGGSGSDSLSGSVGGNDSDGGSSIGGGSGSDSASGSVSGNDSGSGSDSSGGSNSDTSRKTFQSPKDGSGTLAWQDFIIEFEICYGARGGSYVYESEEEEGSSCKVDELHSGGKELELSRRVGS
jgi:hypothetical protein